MINALGIVKVASLFNLPYLIPLHIFAQYFRCLVVHSFGYFSDVFNGWKKEALIWHKHYHYVLCSQWLFNFLCWIQYLYCRNKREQTLSPWAQFSLSPWISSNQVLLCCCFLVTPFAISLQLVCPWVMSWSIFIQWLETMVLPQITVVVISTFALP